MKLLINDPIKLENDNLPERLQRCLPGSEMIQLPKAGHLLPMEDAAEAASDYVHFLQTIRS